MTCPQRDQTMSFIDGELSGEAHRSALEHICECQECADAYDNHRLLTQEGEMSPEEVDVEIETEVMRAEKQARIDRRRKARQAVQWFVAVVILGLLVFFAFRVW